MKNIIFICIFNLMIAVFICTLPVMLVKRFEYELYKFNKLK